LGLSDKGDQDEEEGEGSSETEVFVIPTSVFEALGFKPKTTDKKAPTTQINTIDSKGLVEIVFD